MQIANGNFLRQINCNEFSLIGSRAVIKKEIETFHRDKYLVEKRGERFFRNTL